MELFLKGQPHTHCSVLRTLGAECNPWVLAFSSEDPVPLLHVFTLLPGLGADGLFSPSHCSSLQGQMHESALGEP